MKTSPDPQDPGRALRHLCELARATFTGNLSNPEQAGWRQLEHVQVERPRRRLPLAVGLGLTAVAAASAILLLPLRRGPTTPSLGFRIVDEVGVPHTDPAIAHAGSIEFSDGSHLAVGTEARAAVTGIDARGARIQLERGRLSAQFAHLPSASWSIVAGPYQVLVTGTAFDMSWKPDTLAFELWLRHGSVVVKGPNAGQGLAVVAGQHLLANATSGQIVLDTTVSPAFPDPPASSNAPTPTAQIAPAASPPDVRRNPAVHEVPHVLRAAPSARPEIPERSVSPSQSWAQSLDQGDFQRILDEAAQRGLDNVLGSATSVDLAALADASRYSRRNDLAQRVLLAERERFPQTLAGKDASFFLGTLNDSRDGRQALGKALEWYGRYLVENPAGRYEGQALGRRLVLLDSLHDRLAARETAAQYLAKFPSGPYAAKAERILKQ